MNIFKIVDEGNGVKRLVCTTRRATAIAEATRRVALNAFEAQRFVESITQIVTEAMHEPGVSFEEFNTCSRLVKELETAGKALVRVRNIARMG